MGGTITPEELRKAAADRSVTILDVRRKEDFDADTRMIAGAVYRDPERVEQWSEGLRGEQDVVIYCVRGGSVSKSVSERLRREGIRVSFIEGGITAWKESGGELQEK